MSWPVYALGPLIKADGGLLQTGPFGSQLKQAEYTKYGIPVIMPKDIENGQVNTKTVARVPAATADRLSRHKIRSYGIVLPRRGAITKRAFIRPDQEGWLCGTGCIKIEATGRRIWPKYLYYYMGAIESVRWLEKNAVGSTMLNLSAEIVSRFPLACPAIEVQQQIANVLSAYDDLIDNNRRRIALLEEAARLLYRQWFVHLRFPGHDHIKIIDGLPQRWRRRTLVELAKVVMGQSPKSQFYNDTGEGLPFHQGVTNFGFRFVSHHTYSSAVTKVAEAGDILVSVRAPVGRINITRDTIIVGRGLAAIRSRSSHQSFLFYALKNHFFAENIIGTGAIYAATNKKELEGQILLEPPPLLLRQFEDQANAIDLQIACLTNQNDSLAQARDLLLPRLMNGEISV